MKLELHIEELVLEGFDPRDRHRMRDAVERELARLLAGAGGSELPLFNRNIEVEKLQAAFTAKPGATARHTGTEVARAVHRAVAGAGAPAIPANGRSSV